MIGDDVAVVAGGPIHLMLDFDRRMMIAETTNPPRYIVSHRNLWGELEVDAEFDYMTEVELWLISAKKRKYVVVDTLG